MGFRLFGAHASHAVRNPAFQGELLLIAAALVNIVIAHAGPWQRMADWGTEAPDGAEVAALLSVLPWSGPAA
jgi:hypothetical protein